MVRFAHARSFTCSQYLVAVLPHLKQAARRKKCLPHRLKMNFDIARATGIPRGLPEKTIAKNFAPLITYPHSNSKHLEKWPFTKST